MMSSPIETSESLKQRGNELYKEKRYLEAIEFYNQALERVEDLETISHLLLNVGTVTMKIDTSIAAACVAVFYAASSLTVAPQYTKARIRLLNELHRIGKGKLELHNGYLHTDTNILLAISDAMEGCIDEILVRQSDISGMKVGEEERLTDLKARGNALVTNARYSDALLVYLSAIRRASSSTRLALLLSNRALCCRQLNRPAEALQNALCAVCCDPLLAKAYFHVASALSDLGQPQRAKDAATVGLQIDPRNIVLLQLIDRLSKTLAAAGGAGGGQESNDSVVVNDAFMRERLKKVPHLAAINRNNQKGANKGMTAQEHQAQNQMLEMVMAAPGFRVNKGLGPPIRTDIAPFHTEFAASRSWPVLCDVPKCESRLLNAFENGRGAATFYQYYFMKRSFEQAHYIRRMNPGLDFETITSWFQQAHFGEINLTLKNRALYDPRVLHCFANAPNRCENLTAGETTVSIGFVDLGLLREATMLDSSKSLKLSHRWVGYEASAYCVAKTAATIAMLQLNASVDSILQVWYSAAWSSKTLVAFRRAVAFVLDGRTHLTGALHPDVRVLLQTWQSAKVSLQAARSAWLDMSPDEIKWRDIGNFKRKEDRMALCAYSISGQLLEATTGSVVMFVLPSGYLGSIGSDQRVFECISTYKLLDRCNADSATDIVTATIHHLRDGITKLVQWVQEGRVVMDVRLGAVDPDDREVVASIAALDPHTITWSNVCDYYFPHDFHSMARACSGSNTIHHAYRYINQRYCFKNVHGP